MKKKILRKCEKSFEPLA